MNSVAMETPAPVNVNVGVLGHVDSGKTHLVRVLSTHLSTAALDKHPQSQERGMTLDLGFSSFRLPSKSGDESNNATEIQITLVDCPGHASLFKTILGGVHIIDSVLLVVDIQKGLQPQTIECLLLAELAVGTRIVVALNKIDLVPESQRPRRIQQVQSELRKFFQGHFQSSDPKTLASISIIPVAAAPGSHEDGSPSTLAAIGISDLVSAIQATLTVPTRDESGPLCYAIDHCFSIQGNGTILTGTILSGSVSVGDTIELPRLQATKKVKSMQMFKKSVTRAVQGDRVALRVNGLDASLVERGMAITPGSLPFVSQVIIPVHQIAFFQATCKTGAKIHATIGHTTVVAVATFFQSALPPKESLVFDSSEIYRAVKEVESIASSPDRRFHGFALLQFEQPVICPPRTHVVCSRFDLDPKRYHCRLAFHGEIQTVVVTDEGQYGTVYPTLRLDALRIGNVKERAGVVDKLVHKDQQVEVLAKDMFAKDVDWTVYTDCSVLFTESKCIGTILGPFGKSGKFRIAIQRVTGPQPVSGEKVVLRFIKLVSLRPLGRAGDRTTKDTKAVARRKLIQDDRVLYAEATVATVPEPAPSPEPTEDSATRPAIEAATVVAGGLVERLKGETTADGRNPFIIVSGLFADEVSAAAAAGHSVRCIVSGSGAIEIGEIEKPFGKAGKVRVVFPAHGGTLAQVGDRIELA